MDASNNPQLTDESHRTPRLRDMERLLKLLAVALMLAAVLRLAGVALSADGDEDWLFIPRQAVTIINLALMSHFFYTLYLYSIGNLYDSMRLNTASLVAMIGCLVKFVFSFLQLFPFYNGNPLAAAYNLTELAIWLLLALFFGRYWRYRVNRHRK